MNTFVGRQVLFIIHNTLKARRSTSQVLSNVGSFSILAISLLYLDAFTIRSWGKSSFALFMIDIIY